MTGEQVTYHVDVRKMRVTLSINKPKDVPAEPILPEDLEDFLMHQGVTVGVDHNALVHLATGMVYDKEILVAQGYEPENGEDGYYEYFVNLEDMKSKPVVAEDGTVDYLNSLQIAMVEEGDTIAVYHAATTGKSGLNVFGESVRAVPGRNMSALKGKGIGEVEDGNTYVAKTSGRIYLDGKRVCIDPIYTVPGDLGIGHGNIKFNGDVQIGGDMHSGLQIDAKGSIFIKGHVGNCKLTAGKNVTIGEGIQGKYGCEIIAGGDVAANFVEHCSITAGGNVYANSLLNSTVQAKDSVVVTSKDGKIIGGSIQAIQAIRVKTLGNESGVRTRLTFGDTEELVARLLELTKRKQKVEMDISILEEKAKALNRKGTGAPESDVITIKRQIAQAKILRQTEDAEIMKEMAEIQDMAKRAKENAHVRVLGVVYNGVIFSSEGAAKVQTEAMKDVVFVNQSNQVVCMSPEEWGKE